MSTRIESIRLAVIFLVLVLAGGSARCGRLEAQVILDVDDEVPGRVSHRRSSFGVRIPQPEMSETFEDLRRLTRRGSWEKAFKQVDKLVTDKSGDLYPGEKNGFRVPLQNAIFGVLARLPDSGKNAYRMFYDAKAKTLWEQAQKEHGPAEVEKLSQLSSLYLFTSVGDAATNRLGDLLFEQGDPDGAVDAWKRILDRRPDSTLPRLELLVKTARAMAQAGQWTALAQVAREVSERHAGEKIAIAGKEVAATEYVAQLIAQPQASAAAAAGDSVPDLVLPESDEPVWQLRLLEARVLKMRRSFWNYEMAPAKSDMVMPTVVAGDRLYANWMGCDFAVDLKNGKLVWWTKPFHEAIPKRQTQQYQIRSADRYELAIEGDEFWSITPVDGQVNMQNQQSAGKFTIIRRDKKTGKELFSSEKLGELNTWSPLGAPVIANGMVYLAAVRLDGPQRLHAIALRAGTGRVAWTTHLGNYPFSPGLNTERGTKAALRLVGTRLYVDTHSGGLIELEASSGEIRWAYSYESDAAENHGHSWYDMQRGPQPFNPTVPFVRDGRLYIKGMQSPRLCVLDLESRTVAWKRAVPPNAALVGIDESRVYLTGEDVLAYDVKTQNLSWTNRLPQTTNWVHPLLTEHRFYQFTPRGIYELDKATGNVLRVFRGADQESAGGDIIVTPDLLITVSNRAVTAYPLRKSAVSGQTPTHAKL